MLEPGLTGMLGLGDGICSVCFLTLLVKKKEKRGRRVSAVDLKSFGLDVCHIDTLVCLRFEKTRIIIGSSQELLVYITLVNFERKTVSQMIEYLNLRV